uniref:Formin binding protein 1-like n=1 Tax=Cyprinus carpio TaxID=7962 RepID=A0A8C1Y1N7_CYPCA
ERYAKFVKERLEIEQTYAKQLRSLVKKYFMCVLTAQKHVSFSVWILQSKKKFERECKEAEKSQLIYERLDSDINATKSEVEKAKSQLYLRQHMAEESKNEYAAQLQNFNSEQWKHFNVAIPQIFKNLQDMDGRRTVKLGEMYQSFAEVEQRVIPIISKCLEGMVTAAKNVDERRDSGIVVESFKSGFEPPGDFPFEDFSQNIQRTGSDGTIGTPKTEGGKPDPKHAVSRTKNKLWLFGKKPKLPPSIPPRPPSLPRFLSGHFQPPKFSTERIANHLSKIRNAKSKIPSFRAVKRGVRAPTLEDLSHLPPEQRRKKLQQRIDELNKELQKEMDQRDALNKMKDVYEKNPQMGDPGSLQPKISETICNMEKLRSEIHKNESWLAEVEGKHGSRSERRASADVNHHAPHGRESPEGSYTDDHSQEHRSPPQPDPHEFDYEFDDDDPLPAIGHCKALYSFDGSNEGTLVMKENEVLYIIEEDKGDGWTRVRKQGGEEGYVPTSYVEISLEKNSKGAVTYI